MWYLKIDAFNVSDQRPKIYEVNIFIFIFCFLFNENRLSVLTKNGPGKERLRAEVHLIIWDAHMAKVFVPMLLWASGAILPSSLLGLQL